MPTTSDVEQMAEALVSGDVLAVEPELRPLVAATLADFVARLRAVPPFEDPWVNIKAANVAARIDIVIEMLKPKPTEDSLG